MRLNPFRRGGEKKAPGKTQGKWRKRARTTGKVLLVLVIAGTIFSFSYNIATADRAKPPKGLTYVRTGDIETRYRTWGPAGGTPIRVANSMAQAESSSVAGNRVMNSLQTESWLMMEVPRSPLRTCFS